MGLLISTNSDPYIYFLKKHRLYLDQDQAFLTRPKVVTDVLGKIEFTNKYRSKERCKYRLFSFVNQKFEQKILKSYLIA